LVVLTSRYINAVVFVNHVHIVVVGLFFTV